MKTCPKCSGQMISGNCVQCGFEDYMAFDYSHLIIEKDIEFPLCTTDRNGKENMNYGARLPVFNRSKLNAGRV